jgi:GST-like protein
MLPIDLYYWTTPNGHKITIFLEEAQLPYQLHPIDINSGDQFTSEFLAISPNNRIPAIVDSSPFINSSESNHVYSAESISLFESGAILEYLADKTQRFLPSKGKERYSTLQWLHWQMGGLGPMAGQNHHFSHYAPEKMPYAVDRYVNETHRLYGVLNKQLSGKDYITNEYSIADMACYPWIKPYERQGQDLNDFPHLKAWLMRMTDRPAVQRAYAKAELVNAGAAVTQQGKSILFGQKKSD